MEQEWGFAANHPGQLSEDYMQPGGKTKHDYRSNYTNI